MQSTSSMYSSQPQQLQQQQQSSAGTVVPVIDVPAQPLPSTTATPVASLVRSIPAPPQLSALPSNPNIAVSSNNGNNGNNVNTAPAAQLSLPSRVMPSASAVASAAAAAAASAIQRAQDAATPPLGVSNNAGASTVPLFATAPLQYTSSSATATNTNTTTSDIAAQPPWSSLPSSSAQPFSPAAVVAVAPTSSQPPQLPASSSASSGPACSPKSNLSLVLRHGGPFTRGPNSLPPTMPSVPRSPPRRPFPPRFRMPAVVQPGQGVSRGKDEADVRADVPVSSARAVGQSVRLSQGLAAQQPQDGEEDEQEEALAVTSGAIDTAAAVVDTASSSKPPAASLSSQMKGSKMIMMTMKSGAKQAEEEQPHISSTTNALSLQSNNNNNNNKAAATTTITSGNSSSGSGNANKAGVSVQKATEPVVTVAPHPKKNKKEQQQQQQRTTALASSLTLLAQQQQDVCDEQPLRPTELLLDDEDEDDEVRVVEAKHETSDRSQRRRMQRMQEAYALAAVRRANEFDSPAVTGLAQNILAPEILTDEASQDITGGSDDGTDDDLARRIREMERNVRHDTVYRRLPFRGRTDNRSGASPAAAAAAAAAVDIVDPPPATRRSRSSNSRMERKVSPQLEFARLPSTQPPHLSGTTSPPQPLLHGRNTRYRGRYSNKAHEDGGASAQAWRAVRGEAYNPARSATPPAITAESTTARQLLRWRHDGRHYVRDGSENERMKYEEAVAAAAANARVTSFPSTPGIAAPPAASLLSDESPMWHATRPSAAQELPAREAYTRQHAQYNAYRTRSRPVYDDDDEVDEVAEALYLRRKKYFNDTPMRSPSPRLQQQQQHQYHHGGYEAAYSPRERDKLYTTALPAHIADKIQEQEQEQQQLQWNYTDHRNGARNDDPSVCVIRVTVMNEAQDGGLARRPSRNALPDASAQKKSSGQHARNVAASRYDTRDSEAIELDSHFETGGPCVVVLRVPRKLLRQVKVGHLKRQLERQLGLPAELQRLCAEGVALQDALPLALLQQPARLTLNWLTAPSLGQAVGGPSSNNSNTSTAMQQQQQRHASAPGRNGAASTSRRPSRGFLLLSPPKDGVASSHTTTEATQRTTSLVMQQLIHPETRNDEPQQQQQPLFAVDRSGRASSRSLSRLTSPRLHSLMALLPQPPQREGSVTYTTHRTSTRHKGHRPRTIANTRAQSGHSTALHRQIDAITSDTVSRLSRHASPVQYASDDDNDEGKGRLRRYSSSSSSSSANDGGDAPAAGVVRYSGITAL